MANTSLAQNNILELLPGSERLEYDKESGTHRLYGNVSFKYQGNTMYCDSAYYQEKHETVLAYGHVHINKRDTLNLFCDSLYYNGRTRMAKLWGNVRVRDNEFKLTTDTLEYDAKKSQAFYRYGGNVESIVSKEKLSSKVGYFYPESKNFYFSKNVHYEGNEIKMQTDTLNYLYSQKKTFFHGPTDIQTKEENMYCEYGWFNTETEEGSLQKNASIARTGEYISGDTLLYLPKEKLSIGIGNVYYIDTTEKLSFTGDYAYNSDSLKYSFITGNAIATKFLDDDTLYVHADTLHNYKADSLNELKAFYSAMLFSSKFQGVADSIIYSSNEKKIGYFGKPIIWSKNSELKGDSIQMTVTDSTVQMISIFENASILMEVEKELYYNQISGQFIDAYFNENDLYKAIVNGSATTIYYPEDTATKDSITEVKRMGMNRLYASQLRVDIDSNEVTGVTYLDQPDGMFYPMDQIKKEEQFIKGFSWNPLLRPKELEDLHD